MKKISLIALALCVNAALFAQGTQPQLRTPMTVKTRIGLRGGLNLANFIYKDQPSGTNSNSKTSFNAGVFANIPLAGIFRFQPEVNFSSQGAKLKGTTGTTSVSVEQDMHYINVPLTFQLQTKNGFFVETGPQVGYLVSAKSKVDISGSSSEDDNKADFEKIDFSWSAGLGYLSRIGLGVDFRYNLGLTDINKGSTSNSDKVKNGVTQLSLIYHFGAFK